MDAVGDGDNRQQCDDGGEIEILKATVPTAIE
jgi:hypothetical protein